MKGTDKANLQIWWQDIKKVHVYFLHELVVEEKRVNGGKSVITQV